MEEEALPQHMWCKQGREEREWTGIMCVKIVGLQHTERQETLCPPGSIVIIIIIISFDRGSHYIAQAGLELTIVLPQSPKC